MITAAEQYHEAYPDGGLSGFLDVISLNATDNARETVGNDVDRVTLMTLHAAKGLEFPVVFITGCEDGVFPLKRQGVVGDLEEERRLMYVGITRAMEELYLSCTRARMMYGQTNRNEPSQFLDEIPPDCFENKDRSGRRELPEPEPRRFPGKGPAALAGLGLTTGAALKQRATATADPFARGDQIRHTTYGDGQVAELRGDGPKRVVVVDFPHPVGRKEFLLSFISGRLTKT